MKQAKVCSAIMVRIHNLDLLSRGGCSVLQTLELLVF